MLRKLVVPFVAILFAFSTAPTVRAAPLLDVMLLVDGSGSVSSADFINERALGQYLINSLTFGSNDTALGIVSFGSYASLVTGLTENRVAALNANAGIVQLMGQTNHGDAFLLAANELAANGRAGARQAVILLTDGVANVSTGILSPTSYAIQQADALKSAGVEIFAIGFGSGIDPLYLQNYVSAPSADYAFNVPSYNDGYAALDSIGTSLTAVTVAAVPAPEQAGLLALGLLGLGLARRRARR